MVIAILACIFGILIGFFLGRLIPKNVGLYVFLGKMYKNLDNLILVASCLVVIGSIYFGTMGKLEDFASVTINIFGSVVFSWLLTKKSAKIEFKEQQEELALRSFRHINYIDSAANTAYKKIEKYLMEDDLDEKVKLMLNSAMDQIKYIQGGINTCKMDWHDMLSDKEKAHYKYSEIQDIQSEEFGTVDVVVPDVGFNQEEA